MSKRKEIQISNDGRPDNVCGICGYHQPCPWYGKKHPSGFDSTPRIYNPETSILNQYSGIKQEETTK